MSVIKNQKGNAIVEATIVFPIIIMIVIVLFYAALFLCQKANLQANLQTALLYYKNAETDTYVQVVGSNDDQGSTNILNLHANKYTEPNLQFPYRNFLMNTKNSSGDFKGLFNKIAGQMFFQSSDVEVTYKTRNAILYQDITATATQKVKIPVDFKLLGIDPEITLSTEARVVVTDPDEFVRTSQLVGDVVADTKLGEAISNAEGKIATGYQNLKKVLHIK